jgi:hypothetical protein
MMNVPVYYPFLSAPGNGGRNAIEVPLVLNGPRWEMDITAMGDAIDNRTRLFMFCNPQNPTGRIYTRDELVELARFCERHDLLICSDEIHCDLRLDADRPHIPIATLSEEIAARTITLMAPTKSYNTPGLCCAFAVIQDAALRRRFSDARAGLVPNIGALAYTAALAAYEDPSDWLDRLRAYLAINRDALEQCVAKLSGVSMTHVEGTYLGWIDVRGLRLDHPCPLLRGSRARAIGRRAVSRTWLRTLQLRMSARDARRRSATVQARRPRGSVSALGIPQPPPPGVAIVSTSPSRTSSATFDATSTPFNAFDPGAPASPPARPHGACVRRSVNNVTSAGSRNSSSLTIPSPPEKRPAPPELRRTSYRVTRNG